jgi:cytochrome b561
VGASLVAATLAIGWWMLRIPDDVLLLKYLAFQVHKLLGLLILTMTIPRLWLRLRRGRPSWAGYPIWQRRAAATMHGLLYLLLAAVPALGYVAAVTAPLTVPILSLVPIPALPGSDPARFALFATLHARGVVMLAVLAGGHATAALIDHRRGRATLRAMWGALAPGKGLAE